MILLKYSCPNKDKTLNIVAFNRRITIIQYPHVRLLKFSGPMYCRLKWSQGYYLNIVFPWLILLKELFPEENM